ncbi:MAG: hypothetical protein AB1716_02875 [Planctomycetota bacterium]
MRRSPLGLAFVLLAAGPAVAQLQRVYVFPQETSVSPGQAGLLVGMCLDPKVIGAPGSRDPITRIARPEVIVVRKLSHGEVVEMQSWADVAAGAAQPWVRFEGASDITGHVSLRAVAVRPEPNVTYEVEFLEGTATARPQESLTGSYLARLAEYEASFGVLTRELDELRAAFPADALLNRLVGAFANQSLYPYMSRDARPQDLERKVERFMSQLRSALLSGGPYEQLLLAALVGAAPEPTPAQRAFFERHGISLDRGSLKPREAAAIEQFRGVYGEAIFQACAALCAGEPYGGAKGLEMARRALGLLAEWRNAGLACDGPDIAYALGPAFRAEVRDGTALLSRDFGLPAFKLADLITRLTRIRNALGRETRRRNIERGLARVQLRVVPPAVQDTLSAAFFERELPEQTLGLLRLGEYTRDIRLEPALREVLHTGRPLAPALRLALGERRWLIDVQGLSERDRRILTRQIEELTKLAGIECTLLDSAQDRQRLAVAPASAPAAPPEPAAGESAGPAAESVPLPLH